MATQVIPGMHVGIIGTATTLTDDVASIQRARQAQCHQLRILHSIRMNAPGCASVTMLHKPNSNVQKTHQTSDGNSNQHPSPSQIHGRSYLTEVQRMVNSGTIMQDGARSKANYVDSNRTSNAGETRRGRSRTQGEIFIDNFQDTSWDLIKWILLMYAVVGVTYLLINWFLFTPTPPDPTPPPDKSDVTYDCVI